MTWLPCDERQAREACLEWWREYMAHPENVDLGGGMVIAAFIAGAKWSAGLRGDD